MKISFLFFFLLLASSSILAQYWQQRVDYKIDVTLNDKENTLDGFEKIGYTNHSPDTLRYIWFHLWPNAYKNDKTSFSDQLLENGSTAFYFSSKEQKGYINRLDFKVDGIRAKTEDHPQYIDVIKVLLPTPLLPDEHIAITTPFHVKLPYNFSRGGYDGKTYQVTQWYPKPAVYDANGWHPMPYLDQGEFYSEYGSYDVSITVPKAYVIAATGRLQDAAEKRWLKERKYIVDSSRLTVKHSSHTNTPAKRVSLNRNVESASPTPFVTKTLQYLQDSVHDFAWFADKAFIVQSDTCWLASGKVIEVYSYYTPKYESTWKNSIVYGKEAIRFYSTEVGEYPYSIVSVVQGPQSFGGGMEYPTITVISPPATAKDLDITLTHEVGHNWFYGILGSNERVHPWMDEGINSFYEHKYAKAKYSETNAAEEILFQTKAKRKLDQPIETPSDDFSTSNYALVAYHKTAKWMQGLEQQLGAAHFRQIMQQYFQQWQFKHPQPQDLEAIFTQAAGDTVRAAFQLLHNKGLLPNEQKQPGWQVVTPFAPKTIPAYLNQPNKNTLVLSPVIGANNYDKLMIGGLITNYKFPPSDFQFLAIPFYATGSKKFTGLGKLHYSFYPDAWIRKWDVFLNAALFSMDRFTDSAGKSTFLQFRKLVPGFRLTLHEKNARSTVKQYLQWKTFLLNEDALTFNTDTVLNGRDTMFAPRIGVQKNASYINQLKWVYENYRVLYPFDITVQAEQGKDFFKPTLTANYFFNYGEEGGLRVRFFGGKFFYLGGKTTAKQYATDRYQLNLTGPKGYEDYTYSDYFIGRNDYEGIGSQQIMIRDGAFKVRTDLLSGKVGKTDNWLMAANFNSTIPDKLNPFSVLPIKVPLHLFLDIGTYAEAWKPAATTDHFLFDAGLHLPLFDELINIYVPLFYSNVYRDYFKTTILNNRFLKTISFSIKFNNSIFKKINHELEF